MTPELQKTEADNCDAQSGLSPAPLLGIPVEWTVFLYEIRQSSVTYLYNLQDTVKATTRDEAIALAQKLECFDTHLIGVSLVPTHEYNSINCFNWKWKA